MLIILLQIYEGIISLSRFKEKNLIKLYRKKKFLYLHYD
jgi:hypothetical protein